MILLKLNIFRSLPCFHNPFSVSAASKCDKENLFIYISRCHREVSCRDIFHQVIIAENTRWKKKCGAKTVGVIELKLISRFRYIGKHETTPTYTLGRKKFQRKEVLRLALTWVQTESSISVTNQVHPFWFSLRLVWPFLGRFCWQVYRRKHGVE